MSKQNEGRPDVTSDKATNHESQDGRAKRRNELLQWAAEYGIEEGFDVDGWIAAEEITEEFNQADNFEEFFLLLLKYTAIEQESEKLNVIKGSGHAT